MPRRSVAKTWGEGSRRAVAAESGDVPYHERWAFPVLTFPAEAAVRMAAEEPACAGWVRPGGKSREAVSETGESVPASESAEREAFLPLVRSGQIGVGRERTSGALFRRRAGRGLRPAGNVHRQLLREGEKGSVLRMKIGTDSPVYLAFSLRGFTAARNRSLRLLEETKRIYPPHRDFFEEEKPAPPARRKGGARFL